MKKILVSYSISLVLLSLVLNGCVTKMKSIDNDIAALKNRVIELEDKLNAKNLVSKESDLNKKTLLTINTAIENMNIQLQKINGEIDYLKTAIKLPSNTVATNEDGTTTNTQEENLSFEEASIPIGEMVASIEQRMASLEEAQKVLLSTIKTELGEKDTQQQLKTAKDIKSAYTQKKYTQIIQDADLVLKGTKSKQDKGDVLYYYAESLFKKGMLNEAALKFNDLLDLKQKTSLAKLRLGDTFYKLGDKSTAKLYYQDILDNHPKSIEVSSAREKLAKLERRSLNTKVKPVTNTKLKKKVYNKNTGVKKG